MYYSLHTTETAQHHTGDVKYGRTQKRQTGNKRIRTIFSLEGVGGEGGREKREGRKSSNNRKWLRRRESGEG